MTALAKDPLASAVSHRVLPGWQQKDGTYVAGLEIILAPGWKTYWRSPGDAGIPPSFDWGRARNLKDVQVHWPSPSIFLDAGMRSIGYKRSVILPLTLTPDRDGKDMRLRGRMELGVCSDICIPATIDIDTVLPATSGKRSPQIAASLATLPYSASEAGLRKATCAVLPKGDSIEITASLALPATGGKEEAVIEPGAPGIWVSEAKTSRKGEVLTVSAEMMHHTGQPFALNRSDIRITVIGGSYSVDIQGCTGS